MTTISLCMIVKDEESYLENCLNSVKELVDEIVIVDTGSGDKTLEIAKKFNAKVIHNKWEDDFSKARNISLDNAKMDWILVLDADETIAIQDLQKIKELIKNNDYDGYMLIQRTYTNNSNSPKWISSKDDKYEESKQYSGWIYSGITRLFKNRKDIRFEYPVHETVKESIKRVKGKIAVTNIQIHHYGKLRDVNYVTKKSELYLKLGKEKIKDTPNAKFYYELGIQAQVLGNIEDAITSFNKAIEINPQIIGAYVNLGNIYCKLGIYDKAVEILKNAENINPNNSDLHNNLGIAYEKQDKIEEAFQEYGKSILLNPNNIEALLNASRILFQAGELERVKTLLKRVLKLNPK
ncbi:MAG: glycosyltransferase, partial [Nanoarchaeota archaeon]